MSRKEEETLDQAKIRMDILQRNIAQKIRENLGEDSAEEEFEFGEHILTEEEELNEELEELND